MLTGEPLHVHVYSRKRLLQCRQWYWRSPLAVSAESYSSEQACAEAARAVLTYLPVTLHVPGRPDEIIRPPIRRMVAWGHRHIVDWGQS